jgi:hypothetical protein
MPGRSLYQCPDQVQSWSPAQEPTACGTHGGIARSQLSSLSPEGERGRLRGYSRLRRPTQARPIPRRDGDRHRGQRE